MRLDLCVQEIERERERGERLEILLVYFALRWPVLFIFAPTMQQASFLYPITSNSTWINAFRELSYGRQLPTAIGQSNLSTILSTMSKHLLANGKVRLFIQLPVHCLH